MNYARKAVQPSLRAGDAVPESGVYRAIHSSDCSSRSSEMILLTGRKFPSCRTCGSKVGFQLQHPAPHISEDPDFQTDD